MGHPGGILALDLSTHVGWAYGHAGDNAPPENGLWELPTSPDLGRRFCAYENELIDAIADMQPGLVSMEAPLPANRQNNAYTAELQIGLAAITHCVCHRWEKPLHRPSVSTVRSKVIGQGHIPRDLVERVVRAWCRERGWNPMEHNAADACVVFAYEARIWASRAKVRHAQPILPAQGAVEG